MQLSLAIIILKIQVKSAFEEIKKGYK